MHVSFATAPGDPDKPNEDWVGATSDSVVVLDGITTPDGFDTGCLHGTVWYVHQLGAALLGRVSGEHSRDLRDHLRDAIGAVAELHAPTCDLEHPGTPSATVAMLREREERLDWLVLSDAFVVLDTTNGIEAHTDPNIARFAVAERSALLGERIGRPGHDAARRALVQAQRQVRNIQGGYWVAGANPHAANHVRTDSLPTPLVRRAAVLSDGAAVLAEHYGLFWSDVLDDLTREGPEALIVRIRALELDDPCGTIRPRFKTSDDATVAFCRL